MSVLGAQKWHACTPRLPETLEQSTESLSLLLLLKWCAGKLFRVSHRNVFSFVEFKRLSGFSCWEDTLEAPIGSYCRPIAIFSTCNRRYRSLSYVMEGLG